MVDKCYFYVCLTKLFFFLNLNTYFMKEYNTYKVIIITQIQNKIFN